MPKPGRAKAENKEKKGQRSVFLEAGQTAYLDNLCLEIARRSGLAFRPSRSEVIRILVRLLEKSGPRSQGIRSEADLERAIARALAKGKRQK